MGTAKQLVDRAWDAIESGDIEGLGELFHDDAELSTAAGAGRGSEYVKQVFTRHHEGYPDLRHVVVDAIESAGGDAVALRLAFTATHLGELRGPYGTVAPTGKQLRWRSSDQVRAAGGKIISWHAQFDRLTILQQLGQPAPGPAEGGAATAFARGAGAVSPNKAVLRRILAEVFELGQVEVLDELLTADFVNHRVPPGLGPGIDGVKALVALERSGFPDLAYTVEHEVEEGDFVVQVAMAEGTHRGTIFGVPATGRHASWRQVHIARMRKGQMSEHWGVSDLASLWIQIGRAAPIAPVSGRSEQDAPAAP